MDNVDLAKEGLEHAHHHAAPEGVNRWTLCAAMGIAVMSAAAVVAEMSANDAQTAYLASHIAASDTWSQYQAKSVRRTVYLQSIPLLEALKGSRKAVEDAKRQSERMMDEPGKDGMLQLAERAKASEEKREHELHLRNGVEVGVRGLQIAIVFASLSVATGVRWLTLAGGGLGACAAVYAFIVAIGKI
jgi:hypothetical protein